MLKVFIFISFFLSSFHSFGYVVLIDPGHGGEELGAVAKMGKKEIYEKDLTLILSKKIKKYLPKNITSYLTRSFDRTVTLSSRADMADTVKADLFVSIHFNSAQDHSAHGFEVYYLDNHDDAAIKKVEEIENKNVDESDAVINQILIDLVIGKTVSSSRLLATKILGQIEGGIEKRYHRKNRGIRPGLFYVLALSKRPGVLVEVGFMSNSKELSVISKDQFLENYAKSIAVGIENYVKTLPPKNLVLF